ncbi:MAG: DUF192 domain-containing protein [Egibacteraceae bacterium]
MTRVSILTLVLVAACARAPATEPGPLQPSEPFTVSQVVLSGPGGESVEVPVYVADNSGERGRGLMFREHLPPRTGMVFIFPEARAGAFYMKNTLIPLSIAFYGQGGRVLRVLDMEPCEAEPCPLYNPGVAFIGALEVNQGFFGETGLDETWTIELPEDLPAATS